MMPVGHGVMNGNEYRNNGSASSSFVSAELDQQRKEVAFSA